MAETLCQKRALEAFRLDPAKWGGNIRFHIRVDFNNDNEICLLRVGVTVNIES